MFGMEEWARLKYGLEYRMRNGRSNFTQYSRDVSLILMRIRKEKNEKVTKCVIMVFHKDMFFFECTKMMEVEMQKNTKIGTEGDEIHIEP